MAATRDRRGNAGARMARLLDDEEEDDFYKTTYGGFEEEAEDNDYQSEDSDSAATDSDIDIDENDELKSDGEDDEPKRKKRGVDTKAYKEPVKKTPSERKPAEKRKRPKHEISSVQIYTSSERKSMRRSTAMKSEAAAKREQEREVKNKMLKDIAAKKNVTSVRRLTQEELLEEAKLTEQLNLKSLETYERLESEKKKVRVTKQVYRGPVVRYQSLAMPVVEEIVEEPEITVDEDSSDAVKKTDTVKTGEKCERTFITFTDENTFKEIFPQKRARPVQKQLCPITRQPAKYFDPITQTPYATLQAFKCIRDAYAQQLEGQKVVQRKREKTPVPVSIAVSAPGVTVSS